MDTTKIIKGVVNSGRYTVTAPIVKEDYGLYLQIGGVELPSTYEVDFSNSEHNGTSVTMIGNSDGVLIPHQFIDTGKDVFAFLYHVGANYGRTVYKFRIPNKCRPDRTNEEPTPEEQSTIDQAISALNSAVSATAQDVIDADASAQSAQGYAEQAETAKTNAQTYANNASASATSASQSATASANSATASAQSAQSAEQTKTEVEGMVEDAQTSANLSGLSARASGEYATQAQGFTRQAESYANGASGYASQAQTSAQTASAKAQDASGYAQTASTKATESAQSASQALSYKTDAESAKTASQTAQGKAEDAQTAAETAQGKAEDAQEAAETAAASVSASAAQIAQNEADILKAFPTDSASGAVASFPDGADDIPLKSLIVDINPVQDLSQGDPSPENLCPISGWTEVDVEQRGVNLVSAIPQNIVRHNGNPTIICDEDNTVTIKVQRVAAYDACFYAFTVTESMVGLSVTVSAKEFKCGYPRITKFQHGIYSIAPTDVTNSSIHVRTITQDDVGHDFAVRIYNDSGADLTFEQLQLELSSTATPYSPYTGRSITIPLGQTVYGGKLDVLSGELVVDRKYEIFDGSADESWYTYSSTGYRVPKRDIGLSGSGICNLAPTVSSASTYGVMFNASANYIYFFQTVSKWGVATIAELRAWLATNNVEVCYELATPLTIQLTSNQVNSLLGVNNIWADSGDTEVEYRADTKLFIERLTAPDSADMVADANITSGKYFMVGNSLYKATANIANGSAIIVGTNCIRKSLSEALNEINV